MVYPIGFSTAGVRSRVYSDLIICNRIGRAADSGRRSSELDGVQDRKKSRREYDRGLLDRWDSSCATARWTGFAGGGGRSRSVWAVGAVNVCDSKIDWKVDPIFNL